MIPEIGHFALILALCVAVVQGTVPIYGAASGNASLMAVAKPAARGQFLLVLIAFCCLGYAFADKDFSVLYVAANANSKLPLHYRLAAIWGAHEGSLLLWTFILTLWMMAVTFFSTHLPEAMRARILGVMGLVSVGFLLFMLTVSNPFERLIPAAPDGRDLNPLLQDPGMVMHPPMLYMGYVGFSVAFAFAIAALLGGNLDAAWARWSRPWTTVAWCFLTVGIALGSGWAYYELGWGGWWFWDPVENASFMPWLAGTALIHSLAVTDKRGGFKVWTVLLAILAFSLSLLGHLLGPIRCLDLGPCLRDRSEARACLFWSSSRSSSADRWCSMPGARRVWGWVGDSTSFRVSRCSWPTMCYWSWLWGRCSWGRCTRCFWMRSGLGKISVGPPYFDTVFVPLMTPAIFLMGIGPLAQWKKASLPESGDAIALGVWRQRRHGIAVAVRAGQMDAAPQSGPVVGPVDCDDGGDQCP